MATEVQSLFDDLEAQKTTISTCVNIYTALTTHFASLDQAIISKLQILDSKIKTLDSDFQTKMESLQQREDSIPERLSSLSCLVESQRQAAMDEFQKPPASDDEVPFPEALKSLCRKMDAYGALMLVVERRKETTAFRSEIMSAIAESVDSPRLVLDVVRAYVQEKAEVQSMMTDRRWVVGVMVGEMFKADELKKGSLEVRFSRAAAQRAELLAKDWREMVGKTAAEGLTGMQPAEASMFLKIVLGFGLKDKFDEDYYRKLLIEFASRRDMAKLAVPIFGEKVRELIDELLKKGKEVEALYFASESGFNEMFEPISVLKSFLKKTEKKAADIRKKGNDSSSAAEEAKNLEIESIKLIIRCVEDFKLEAKFPLENLRKKLTTLEKLKIGKKKAPAAVSKPSNKRGPNGAGGSWGSGPQPPHRPTKVPRFSHPYPPPPPFAERNPLPVVQHNPVSVYPGPYTYPSQGTYDMALNVPSHGSTYTGSYPLGSAQVTPQPYPTVGGDSHGSVGVQVPVPVQVQVQGSYGGQAGGYASYDYGTTTNSSLAYQPQPSSYIQ